jgi:cobalt/nickel transport system permease protein
MQPIHLAIGVVEGIVTAAVVGFVAKAHPEIVGAPARVAAGGLGFRQVLVSLLAVAAITGGVVSWYASGNPDGLEWAITGVTGREELESPTDGVHGALASLQEKIAFLPDYSLGETAGHGATEPAATAEGDGRLGTSVSGLVGGGLTLAAAFLIGFILRRRAST